MIVERDAGWIARDDSRQAMKGLQSYCHSFQD